MQTTKLRKKPWLLIEVVVTGKSLLKSVVWLWPRFTCVIWFLPVDRNAVMESGVCTNYKLLCMCKGDCRAKGLPRQTEKKLCVHCHRGLAELLIKLVDTQPDWWFRCPVTASKAQGRAVIAAQGCHSRSTLTWLHGGRGWSGAHSAPCRSAGWGVVLHRAVGACSVWSLCTIKNKGSSRPGADSVYQASPFPSEGVRVRKGSTV